MGVNVAALKHPSGLLKILILCINIIVLILIRSGFEYTNFHETQYRDTDAKWLTIMTTGAYMIIIPAILFTYLLGDAVSDKLEFIFMSLGFVLFIIFGAIGVHTYDIQTDETIARRDTGLAWGSLAIIIGFLMLLDSVIILGKLFKSK